ncbi:MAG TPA: cyclic nucleotide-binding domain-containing protein, partial [Polyangia bacterium]
MSESPPTEPTNGPEIEVEVTPSLEITATAGGTDQIAACLTRVSLFADLPAVYLRRIASLGIEESYKRGAPVFVEGTAGDKLYVILSGSVRISRQVPGMGEEALAILKAGDYFG